MIATAGHLLAAPWTHTFMQRALVEVLLMSICGGLLGCWILFYGLTFTAEALPHAMFPGLVGAALLGLPIVAGGAASLLVAGGAIVLAGRTPLIRRETAVAVVFTSFFGVGVLMALSPQTPAGVSDLLFGDILGLAASDLVLAAALALVVAGALYVLHDRLLAAALDRPAARASGIAVGRIDAALMVLIALSVLVAVQAMGNIFVVATLVAPAAAARPVAGRVAPMMTIAILVGLGAGVAGLLLSYYAEVAAGASIAAFDVLAYLAVLLVVSVRRRRVPRHAQVVAAPRPIRE